MRSHPILIPSLSDLISSHPHPVVYDQIRCDPIPAQPIPSHPHFPSRPTPTFHQACLAKRTQSWSLRSSTPFTRSRPVLEGAFDPSSRVIPRCRSLDADPTSRCHEVCLRDSQLCPRGRDACICVVGCSGGSVFGDPEHPGDPEWPQGPHCRRLPGFRLLSGRKTCALGVYHMTPSAAANCKLGTPPAVPH